MIRINNTQYFHFLQQADAMRRSGSLCDAIISVQSQTFRAHRLVLACASSTLAQWLARGGTDSPVHCTLEYCSPHTFQQVLDFTYTQALEVRVEDLQLLLRAAQLLEMQPLEDQCRKQLDVLGAREEGKPGDTNKFKEGEESGKEKDQKAKGSPVHEDKVPERSSPPEKAGVSINIEPFSPADPPNSHSNPKSIKKKSRLSPISATLCNRETVITKPTASSSSSPSPWNFPANMWNSEGHLNTLRRIAENYSNFMAAHPLQSPNQSSAVYPFSLSSPHVLPLLSSHFQNPLPSSVLGYSNFHPCFTQNLYAGGTRMIRHSLLKRKKYSGNDQAGDPSYSGVSKVRKESSEDCQRCSTRLLDDPVLQESASTQLGKSCAGCRFCGKAEAAECEKETREDSREKPYQCKHCPKKFSLKHQLDTHHRVHTGEKPFECRLCGQRSRDYSAMIKHLRTHGGAAPYQCTVCLEFCSSLVAMQRHIKGHALQDFPPDWSINNTYLYISHI
ncbi:zinc finger and BTB domain-containing protein 16-A [Cololabis saira]|uniref:zinc finger and BTB domain-containing protein 16-A n=1 Tax=Cololabis saira TaxID=129043 RepID=UPI002AD480D6|nr:zinc finger and BTB domain-containing protein 16-A [Cololabis saira]XP_061572556.1 zinc finger and BTB domain-containing protein 16-A [Cololabis saira]